MPRTKKVPTGANLPEEVIAKELQSRLNLHLFCSPDPENLEIKQLDKDIENQERVLAIFKAQLEQQQALTDRCCDILDTCHERLENDLTVLEKSHERMQTLTRVNHNLNTSLKFFDTQSTHRKLPKDDEHHGHNLFRRFISWCKS